MMTSVRGLAEIASDRPQSIASAGSQIVTAAEKLVEPLARIRAIAQSLEDGLVEDRHACYRKMGLEVDRLTVLVEQLAETTRQLARPSRSDTSDWSPWHVGPATPHRPCR